MYKPGDHEDYYKSDGWILIRLSIFKRDKYTCLRCDKKFSISNLNPHHMLPRDKGGSNDLSNLVTLCESCHDFVEIQGFSTKAEITGSCESPVSEKKEVNYPKPRKENFERPEWHKYVYGGKRGRR